MAEARFEKKGEGSYLLDVCGMICPHPQIHTKKSLEKMDSGDTLEVVFTNPASRETIRQLCLAAGHEIVDDRQDGGNHVYVIRKG